jgi:predicted Rossmann-fold nucleotide-binding protein
VHMIEPRPVILMDRSLWCGLVDWMRDTMLQRGFIGPADFSSIHCVDTAEEILPIIKAEVEKFRARQEARPEPEGQVRAEQAAEIIHEVEKKQGEAATQ